MAQFAGWLQSYAGRPVLDKTGSSGLFNLRLQFQMEVRNTSGGAGGQEPPVPSDPSGPSVFTALQEQLGLKLESSKATLEVLAVDTVQKPSEN